jgi:UDP-N-acetyl-D-mannosaminuronate dehydrogenase
MPDSPRQWTLQKNTPDPAAPFDSFLASIIGPNTEPVSVVEGSRLREVEAELQDIAARERGESMRLYQDREQLRARVERLEADLQEATAALQWIETRLSRHREPRVQAIDKALERARGVLRKGDT